MTREDSMANKWWRQGGHEGRIERVIRADGTVHRPGCACLDDGFVRVCDCSTDATATADDARPTGPSAISRQRSREAFENARPGATEQRADAADPRPRPESPGAISRRKSREAFENARPKR